MKKFRLFSLILAVGLLVQGVLLPARAAPETTAPVETTVPPETTLPATRPPEPTMPAQFSGDASVVYGSRTLDARKPLADRYDYTAKAKAALLYDLNSDTLVFAQDADVKLYPASLTKIMTCLLTLEMQQDLEQVVAVTAEGLRGMEPGGSVAGLQEGEQLTIRNLLYCLMVKSANDAASTLAAYNSGTIEAFVELMNQRAAQIGCTGTHFANPHGLHDENHYTTARDLAKIMKEAMQYPFFETLFSTKEYVVPATNMSEARELTSTNYLIQKGTYPYVLDSRVIGGKTGFTTPAGRCLAAVSEQGSMKLISVVMGTEAVYGANRYTFVRYGNFEETSELLDYAYDNFTTMAVLDATQVTGPFAVAQGDQDAFGVLRDSLSSAVPKGSTYEVLEYDYALTGGSLAAPVKQGQDIGVVRVWFGDICLAQLPIYSAAAVGVQEPEPVEQDTGPDLQLAWTAFLWGLGLVVGCGILWIFILRMQAIARHRRRAARRRRRK